MSLSPGISLLCWSNPDIAFKYKVCLGVAKHTGCGCLFPTLASGWLAPSFSLTSCPAPLLNTAAAVKVSVGAGKGLDGCWVIMQMWLSGIYLPVWCLGTVQQNNILIYFFSQSLAADCTLVMVLKDCPKVFSWNIKKSACNRTPRPIYTSAAITHTLYLWDSDIREV